MMAMAVENKVNGFVLAAVRKALALWGHGNSHSRQASSGRRPLFRW